MIKGHGIAHVTLTVTDIGRSKKFYETLFETSFNMDNNNSFSLLKVDIPCWFVQWDKHQPGDRFLETRIGLDHVAFKLETLEELEKVVSKLNQMKVPNVGIERFAGKYPYVAFRDPDNIQTEFFIPEEM